MISPAQNPEQNPTPLLPDKHKRAGAAVPESQPQEAKAAMQRLLKKCAKLLDAEVVSFLQLDKASANLHFCMSSNAVDGKLTTLEIPAEGSIAGKVVQMRRPWNVAECCSEPAHFKQVDEATGLSTRNMLAVPVACDELLLGVIEAVNKQRSAGFTPADQTLLECISMELGLLVRLEQERRLNQQVNKYAEIGENVLGLAHNLKNQISQLEGSLSIIQRGLDQFDHALLLQVWPIFSRTAEKVARLARNLLCLAAEREQATERTGLNVVIDELVDEVRMRAATAGIGIGWRSEGKVPDAPVDADRMRNVLLNLVTNAMEAISDAKIADGFIQIAAVCGEERFEISVADNGPGLPPAEVEKAFQPFFTTKCYGTGLGLPMVRKLVQSMRGEINIESEQGSGCVMRISLPVVAFMGTGEVKLNE